MAWMAATGAGAGPMNKKKLLFMVLAIVTAFVVVYIILQLMQY
ncbi:MAG: hypothetical protein ACFFDN_49995 [Candidatus Hodarchaeota archaeon]